MASGTWKSANPSPPRATMASTLAATTGSPGDANGRRSTITQLRASPTTSTPCQKLDVPSSTAFGVERNWASSVDLGAVPWTSSGYSSAPSSVCCTARSTA